MPRSSSRGGWLLGLFALLLPVVGGCNSGAGILRVTGKVSYHGKPVPHLYVNFVPPQGRPSWGVTDTEGRFTLSYDREHKGAVPGKHKVYFEFRPRDPKQEQAYRQGKLKLPPEFPAILAKYGRTTSPLSFEVTTDGQEIDIPLD